MHELSITESIVATVVEHTGTSRVIRVFLEIGRGSGVLPDAVRFCFDLCAQGTTLEGAVLDIAEIPIQARCRACGTVLTHEDLVASCPCGSADLEITAGRELRVLEVEVI
jgi:hydrogenase nickel incorporation protein HypA/HybF